MIRKLRILIISDDKEEFDRFCNEKKKDSRQESNKNRIYWILAQNDEIHRLIDEYFRSDNMIRIHERLASQGQLAEYTCFSEEKIRKDKSQRELRKQFKISAYYSVTIFRGIANNVSEKGKDFPESVKSLLNIWIPDLFQKFSIGAKHLSGKEPRNILNAVNLNGLPSVFYDTKDGLNLVIKQGDKYIANTNAGISQEIINYINEKYSYGEKVTGKMIDSHFGGIGYGWERDIVRVVLATLFRAGIIEITYQGKRYKSYTEPGGKEAIVNNNAYKVSTFSPREKVSSLKHIKDACFNYEAITGKEIDAEENAITQALINLAIKKKDILLSLDAKLHANNFPCQEFVNDFLQTMSQIPHNTPDDCVKYLAEEGKSLKINLEKLTKIDNAITDHNLEILNNAQKIISEFSFALKNNYPEEKELNEKIDSLKENIESEDFYNRISVIAKDSERIINFYLKKYKAIHKQRDDIYHQLEEMAKGKSDWSNLPDDVQEGILQMIRIKYCGKIDLKCSLVCSTCRANIMQMESDIIAENAIKERIIQRLDEFIVKTVENIERIILSDYFTHNISSKKEFKEQLNKFIELVESLLNEGKKIIFE